VLSSAKIGIASWRYYQREVATDPSEYFLARGEAPGRWWGRGLSELGLTRDGVVEERQLEALLARGLHPETGRRLGRAWRTDGVTGFDLCFSAPKSVSGLWAIGGNTMGTEIAEAHRAAVRAALGFLDSHAAMSRKGIDGVEQISTAGFAAAIFDHRTSRAGDPQLHSHALVVNKLRCADGGWRTIDGHEIYHHKKAAGALYQAALRAELTQRLGVVFEPVNAHGQAEIAGVPAELSALWSKRTQQIRADADPTLDRFAAELGRPLTAAERASVVKTSVLKTRPTKRHDDEGVLQTRWRAEAAELGWTPARLVRDVMTTAMRSRQRSTDQVLAGRFAAEARLPNDAVAAAGTRSATFSRADVVVQVAAGLPPVAASADEVRRTVEVATQRALHNEQAVHVGQVQDGVTARASDTRWATADLLATEAAILRAAQTGTRAGRAMVSSLLADHHVQLRGLDAEQADAVRRLTGGGQMVSVLIAPAGAGKTTTIGAAAAAWTAAGYTVLGLAPSARAAAELSTATGTPADTVAKWRYEQPRLPLLPPEDAVRWRVGPRTVLLVDEAAMLATDDLAALTKAVLAPRAKLVLVGDPAQIGPVERAGGLLPALANRVGAVELTGIRRFSQPWEADATRQLRRGNPAIWARYAAHDRIHPAPDLDAALDAVHDRWQSATDAGLDALMMARARTDVDALNHRARAAALAVRDVRGPVLVRAGGRDWQTGDLLRARRNDRRLPLGEGHVRNGDRFRVLGPGPDGGLIVEHLAGRRRAALPVGYLARHADYGWACTIDGAQGATADIGILLARTGLDREHLYVGMTRGRDANHVHLTNQPVDDDHEHRQQAADPTPTIDDAVRILQTATARVGAQQAAHTILDQARDRAQALGLGRRTSTATQLNSDREHGLWAVRREKSRSWSSRPEIPSPSAGRSIGR
jgi:conjugative relaxase-like TrwC/TraI family protein